MTFTYRDGILLALASYAPAIAALVVARRSLPRWAVVLDGQPFLEMGE